VVKAFTAKRRANDVKTRPGGETRIGWQMWGQGDRVKRTSNVKKIAPEKEAKRGVHMTTRVVPRKLGPKERGAQPDGHE